MATYLELKAQALALLRQAEEVRKQEVAEVVKEIKAKITQYNLNPEDLGFAAANKKANKANSPAPVRYIGPNGEKWSGMGRQPQWVKDILAEGKSKEDFAV